jgi:hypothetical protein
MGQVGDVTSEGRPEEGREIHSLEPAEAMGAFDNAQG